MMIGVIVPVYNTQKYLAECIESILAQTYNEFRLILADDGSPDNAGEICDEYAKKDNRITVIHQENAGVTRARARGVEEANDCEWITFVDSDDKLKRDALSQYSALISEDTDIILNTSYSTEISDCTRISFDEIFNASKIPIEKFRGAMIMIEGGMPWGRLFRKHLITQYVFDIPRSIYYGEDAIMNLRIAFNTDKNVKIIETPLYFYRQENNGVCNNFIYTPEYEELLKEYTFNSIPSHEFHKFNNQFISRRLWVWKIRYNRSFRRPDWTDTEFQKNLINDIKKYNCQIPPFDWLLLIYTNPIIRITLITARKAKSLIHKIISGFKVVTL